MINFANLVIFSQDNLLFEIELEGPSLYIYYGDRKATYVRQFLKPAQIDQLHTVVNAAHAVLTEKALAT